MTEVELDSLYRKYAHSVLRRAARILGNAAEAQDVLHEIFLGLMASPVSEGSIGNAAAYLYTVTTNACLCRLRNQRNRLRLLDEQVRPWTSDAMPATSEDLALVRSVLAKLPTDAARAAIYYYYDGMSHEEIAELLGCSRRHVGNLLDRLQLFAVQEAS